MGQKILSVEKGSIADQLGIQAGDELVSINGEKITDRIDYQALSSEEKLTMIVLRDGEENEYTFEKDEWEPLGLGFDTMLMSEMRRCANRCVFCFEEQLPEDARESLRSKDDDWRLSIMTGSFVTLTNVGKQELARIIKRHASPLYVSVHATDPETRIRLLGCPSAGDIMEKLTALKKGGIEYHTQAVLCPGINDGDILEKTITDIAHLYPAAKSLALVPVGLTKYHSDGLRVYTRDEARSIIRVAEKWQRMCLKSYGTRFVFPADEFYMIAEMEVPDELSYEDCDQIDNGIGMVSVFDGEFRYAYEDLPAEKKQKDGKKKITVACGTAIAPYFRNLFEDCPITGTTIEVLPVKNRYFGETVTVSGLLTGKDLADQLSAAGSGTVLITCTCLREGEDVFLDDMNLEELKIATGKRILPVGRRGDQLLDVIVGLTT